MPIRVMHVIGQIGVGGCEKHLLEVCRRMDRTRYDLALCYYSRQADSMIEAFEQTGTKLYFTDKFGGASLWTFFKTLRRFLLDFKPDIIHTWMYSPNVWGRLAGLSCGYRRFICSERSTGQYHDRLRRLMETLLARGTLYTANTQAVADALARRTRFPAERIRVIHNAVDMPAVDRAQARAEIRAEPGLQPETPIVLTVGRQTSPKNYPMFFRTARRVLDARPDVVFLAAGHGEDEAVLAALHRRMGLGPSVRMLGLRHDVPRLMAAADVFCLCSSWEGFPNVLIEAMASGLPAVTTDFAGVREIIDGDGRSGCLIVDVDQDDRMADSLLRLLSEPEASAVLGRSAEAFARERFSWSNLLKAMDRLYAECLEGRPHQRNTRESKALETESAEAMKSGGT